MENTKIKRTTNRDQFREMVEIMKTQPDIARNLTKKSPEQQQDFWGRLQNTLNAIGPPFKEISEWRKVWSDYKSSIKKKLVQNKKSLNKTGSGEHDQQVLTPIEEDVIKLICMQDSVEGLSGTQACGLPKKRKTFQHSQMDSLPSCSNQQDVSNSFEFIEEDEINENLSSASPKRRVSKSNQMQLLKEQIQIQNNHYNTNQEQAKELNENVLKMRVSLERLEEREEKRNEILQSILEESKRHHKQLEEILLLKEANNSVSEFSI